MISKERGPDSKKRVNGRKSQVLTDTSGLVWSVFIHAANEHDSIMGCQLLDGIKNKLARLEKILIDAGYKGTFAQKAWRECGIKTEVSSRPETKKGFVPVKWRWVIERTFSWANFFRRITKDYERTKKVQNQ